MLRRKQPYRWARAVTAAKKVQEDERRRNIPKDFDRALSGEERAQMRQMILGLASHVGALSLFIKDDAVRASSIELARAAVDYLNAEGDTPCPSGRR